VWQVVPDKLAALVQPAELASITVALVGLAV
jgi:hypothetical protein